MDNVLQKDHVSKSDSNVSITKLSKLSSYGDNSDVVRSVTVTCSLTHNGTTYSRDIEMHLDEPSGSFKAFDDLTKLDVIGFIGAERYIDTTTNTLREMEREHIEVEVNPPWLS